MALDTYSNLSAAISDWMARSDLVGNAADWITLGEARLNRHLGAVEVDQTLTGTTDSRSIDISAYSIAWPIALFLIDPASSDEVEVLPKPLGGFEYLDTSAQPRFYGLDNQQQAIKFDSPCDQAYTFRFRYAQRFALSDAAPTNWLLTNHPDLYLAAAITWGCVFTGMDARAGVYKAAWDMGITEVKNLISRGKHGTLTVDPALVAMPRRGSYQGVG